MQVAKVQSPVFAVRSDQFGYPMWSADVPNRPDVEVTNVQTEMGKFENLMAARCMARALSSEWGFSWEVVTCVS
jgi:hypothetical protein